MARMAPSSDRRPLLTTMTSSRALYLNVLVLAASLTTTFPMNMLLALVDHIAQTFSPAIYETVVGLLYVTALPVAYAQLSFDRGFDQRYESRASFVFRLGLATAVLIGASAARGTRYLLLLLRPIPLLRIILLIRIVLLLLRPIRPIITILLLLLSLTATLARALCLAPRGSRAVPHTVSQVEAVLLSLTFVVGVATWVANGTLSAVAGLLPTSDAFVWQGLGAQVPRAPPRAAPRAPRRARARATSSRAPRADGRREDAEAHPTPRAPLSRSLSPPSLSLSFATRSRARGDGAIALVERVSWNAAWLSLALVPALGLASGLAAARRARRGADGREGPPLVAGADAAPASAAPARAAPARARPAELERAIAAYSRVLAAAMLFSVVVAGSFSFFAGSYRGLARRRAHAVLSRRRRRPAASSSSSSSSSSFSSSSSSSSSSPLPSLLQHARVPRVQLGQHVSRVVAAADRAAPPSTRSTRSRRACGRDRPRLRRRVRPRRVGRRGRAARRALLRVRARRRHARDVGLQAHEGGVRREPGLRGRGVAREHVRAEPRVLVRRRDQLRARGRLRGLSMRPHAAP